MLKGKSAIQKKAASTKTEQLRKKALAVTEANIARIEAVGRGEKPPKPDAKAPPKGGKPPKAPKAKRMSGLDAAAKVLIESKEPLAAQDIVKTMASKGYWSLSSPTHSFAFKRPSQVANYMNTRSTSNSTDPPRLRTNWHARRSVTANTSEPADLQ